MFSIQEIAQPNTIEEAYSILVRQKNNIVLGGCAFLRLGSRRIGTALDLSNLDLNYVKEQDGFIEIGALTTLREIEINQLLTKNFNSVLSKAVRDIIGVQFRNVAKVGATVYSKYGFSNLITALLVLDTEVELHNTGRISLDEFLKMPNEKDILTRIFIKKDQRQASYIDLRKSASDFALLNAAVSRFENKWTIAVGARPQKATIAQKASEELSTCSDFNELDYFANLAAEELSFGTNTKGSATYREAMCKVLVKRAITEVLECK